MGPEFHICTHAHTHCDLHNTDEADLQNALSTRPQEEANFFFPTYQGKFVRRFGDPRRCFFAVDFQWL